MTTQPDLAPLSAIVLAAGFSRRAAPLNKLLVPFGAGSCVVRATTEAVCGAGFGEVIVVTGHERERVEGALQELPVCFVFAPDFAGGMGHSLAAGVRAASAAALGFAVIPGDLPWLTTDLVQSVCGAFTACGAMDHVVPVHKGERGHPVVLGAWLHGQLATLTGDTGARPLLGEEIEVARTLFLDISDPAILRDFDHLPATDSGPAFR